MKKINPHKVRKQEEIDSLEIIKRDPSNSVANTKVAELMLMSERELEAIKYIANGKGASRYDWVAQHLVDHFHCRKLLAKKLNQNDYHGEHALKETIRITGLQPSKDVGITISSCMIVKNEEKHLEKCLSQLKPIVDEMVIVDTGSTDRTVEIAKDMGAVVGFREWDDDYSAARNASIKLANCHWLLTCDADEILEEKSREVLNGAIIRPQFGGFSAQILSYLQDDEGVDLFTSKIIRLFRNLPGVKFTGRIHEQVYDSIANHGYTSAEIPGFVFYHYGYQPSIMEKKNKVERSLNILYKELEDKPDFAFNWFNLANTYTVNGRHKDASRTGHKALELLKKSKSTTIYSTMLLQILLRSATLLGRVEECAELCEYAKDNGHYSVLMQTEVAYAYFLNGNYETALTEIDKALEMEWDPTLYGDKAVVEYKRHLIKAEILIALERFDEALEYIDYVIKTKPDIENLYHSKGVCLYNLKRYDESANYLKRRYNDPKRNKNSQTMLKNIYLETKRFEDFINYVEELIAKNEYDPADFPKWAFANEFLKRKPSLQIAEKMYEKIKFEDSSAIVNMARIYKINGKYYEAEQLLIEQIKNNPLDCNAYLNLADVYYTLKKYQEAAKHYQNGLKIDPNIAQAWLLLGNCFAELGSMEGAKLGYTKALQLNPDIKEAKECLAFIEEKEKELTEASA